MSGRRVISDLEISWEDVPLRRVEVQRNPWADAEEICQKAAAYACGCASVLAGIHLFVSFAAL